MIAPATRRAAVEIVGAGPAGLAAGIAVARAGGEVRVYEREDDVGTRFHGDFQGLENWTTDGDVLDEIHSLGIAINFDCRPVHACIFYDADGRPYRCSSRKPLWYLVRRGPTDGSLDQGLKQQALAAGVRLDFSRAPRRLDHGGILASGPRWTNVVAAGYVFETSAPDCAYGALAEQLAPGGYAYLLVSGGRGTLATCLFRDFHREQEYVDRAVEFFRVHTAVEMRHARRFGGYGFFSPTPTPRRGQFLLAGEAAGLQDPLFGFGLRQALVSGHFAGRAWQEGNPAAYESAVRGRLLPLIQAGMVNRHWYERIGDRGWRALLERMNAAPDGRDWLRRHYQHRWWTTLALPWARAAVHRSEKRDLTDDCGGKSCACTRCRCAREPCDEPAPVR